MKTELFGLDLHIRQLDLGYGYTILFGVRMNGKTSFYKGTGTAPSKEKCFAASMDYIDNILADVMEKQ